MASRTHYYGNTPLCERGETRLSPWTAATTAALMRDGDGDDDDVGPGAVPTLGGAEGRAPKAATPT